MADAVRIAFIGAGDVNFGGGEGPWDHALRLERLGGVQVVGVADPDTERAAAQVSRRRGPLWGSVRVFGDYRELLADVCPAAVWIGVPPHVHGTVDAGRDIEIQCARAGVHMFIEKPLSAARPAQVREVAVALADSDVVTSVGYMLRYSRAVTRMKQIIEATPGGAKAFIGRYDCAYSNIRKAAWWDVRSSGGPIVEQATHFVDIARYLVGDADLGSVRGVGIGGGEQIGQLLDVPVGSDGLPCDAGVDGANRHPRVTAAVWKFVSGAVGSLTHGTLLHREKYDTEFEVWGDGLRVVLRDPYGDCRLEIRRPGSEETTEERFGEDDAYLTEDRAFLDAVGRGALAAIKSPYPDALKTHELCWAITDAVAV